MDHHVISLARCGTGWMDWTQGTNRVATKILGPHAHTFFPLGSVKVTCAPYRTTYRLTTIKELSLLLLEALHFLLILHCSLPHGVPLVRGHINGRLLASVFPCETGIKGHPINIYKYKHITVCVCVCVYNDSNEHVPPPLTFNNTPFPHSVFVYVI